MSVTRLTRVRNVSMLCSKYLPNTALPCLCHSPTMSVPRHRFLAAFLRMSVSGSRSPPFPYHVPTISLPNIYLLSLFRPSPCITPTVYLPQPYLVFFSFFLSNPYPSYLFPTSTNPTFILPNPYYFLAYSLLSPHLIPHPGPDPVALYVQSRVYILI